MSGNLAEEDWDAIRQATYKKANYKYALSAAMYSFCNAGLLCYMSSMQVALAAVPHCFSLEYFVKLQSIKLSDHLHTTGVALEKGSRILKQDALALMLNSPCNAFLL